jgi:tRNA(fMet)-specific endonuclease VapC
VGGRYLLDTNAVIALIDGDSSMRGLVAQADEAFIPSPVLGELYFGAFRSRRVRENIGRIDDLVRWYAILSVDETTAKTYGILRHQLSDAGQPIPDNDVWIAAVAQQYGAAIVTRDSHFDAVGNLAVIRW